MATNARGIVDSKKLFFNNCNFGWDVGGNCSIKIEQFNKISNSPNKYMYFEVDSDNFEIDILDYKNNPNLDYKTLSQHLKIFNIQYLPGKNSSFEERINVNTFIKIFKNYFGIDFKYNEKHVFVTNEYTGNSDELDFFNVDTLIEKAF